MASRAPSSWSTDTDVPAVGTPCSATDAMFPGTDTANGATTMIPSTA
ncbi:MAG TPA: hypothetical protein VHO07_04810 [Streptosporangiaceae bacterium]|nr:hypothetical protein [Streptosporangiaceae bacterium]